VRYIIYRFIHDRPHYWDTCGWTRNLRKARAYTHDDARTVSEKMLRRGKVWIAPLTARAGLYRARGQP
jgi:hypothetical protein